MITMLIMIVIKGATRELFYNPLTAHPSVSNMYTQMARAPSCENHVQHTVRLSRATASLA